MKHCLSNTAGLKEGSHFPFSSLPSIQSTLWFGWPKQTLSFCFHYFFVLLLLLEWGCWCECNFWYTLEVAGEFGPAAPCLCSTLNWGFSSNSLSRCTAMLNERTCSEEEASAATFTKNDSSIILFFLVSRSFNYLQNCMQTLGMFFFRPILCIYHLGYTAAIYYGITLMNYEKTNWRWACWRVTVSSCVYWEQKTVKRGNKRAFRMQGRLSSQEKKEKQKEIWKGWSLTLI